MPARGHHSRDSRGSATPFLPHAPPRGFTPPNGHPMARREAGAGRGVVRGGRAQLCVCPSGPNWSKMGCQRSRSKGRSRVTEGSTRSDTSGSWWSRGGAYGGGSSRLSSATQSKPANHSCSWTARKDSVPMRAVSSQCSSPAIRSAAGRLVRPSPRSFWCSAPCVSALPSAYRCTDLSTSRESAPVKGGSPTTISCRRTPQPHQSAALVRPWPRTSSGGVYVSVPSVEYVRVW
mmetsp:Transcript_20900/g.61696  ORF Transcript_20900/g.61696 Transcript_20900/m.61696 type:complete len:233 (-) Transcript_20900:739-1437(-)